MRLVMRFSRSLGLLLGALALGACGGRSDLEGPDYESIATTGGAGGSAAGTSAGTAGKGGSVAGTGGATAGQGGAGTAGVAGTTAGVGGVVVQCVTSADCDDKIPCSLDQCQGGVCTHEARDALCDDGIFCTGAERCDLVAGCVTTPVVCNDGVSCTDDVCDESVQGCTSSPNDANCPLSHKCGPGEGCYALAYAHSTDTLYEVRLPSGKVTKIGPTHAQLTDIALVSNTQLYGINYQTIYQLDTSTGDASFLAPVDTSNMVAFDVAPDGRLYVGGGQGLYLLDLVAGITTPIASYPFGFSASGDIAVLQGRLLGTARTSPSAGAIDSLVEFDVNTGDATVIGSTGSSCIWGLAAFGETLYGLTCQGQVLRLDAQTGAATVLSTGGPAFWGASAR